MKYLLFLFFLIVLFFSIMQYKKNNRELREKNIVIKEGGLSQISELAVYMREIHHQALNIREKLSEGNLNDISNEVPERYNAIFTSEPTDKNVSGEKFTHYASEFIEECEGFYSSSKKEKIFRFNSMINSCVNCHQEFCPGPVKKINKLKI
jgi:hypothetical protein